MYPNCLALALSGTSESDTLPRFCHWDICVKRSYDTRIRKGHLPVSLLGSKCCLVIQVRGLRTDERSTKRLNKLYQREITNSTSAAN